MILFSEVVVPPHPAGRADVVAVTADGARGTLSDGVESVAPKKNQKQKPNQPGKAIRLALGNDVVDQDSSEPGINQAKQS